MALEMKSEGNPIVDANLFVAHPGFSTINETIFGHLDPETLANCRLVSKAWKHFIDTSKKVLLVQVDQLMNYDMKIPETFDRKDGTYEVTSIVERWPRYQRILKFLKTKATLDEIELVLRFLKEYCRKNTFGSWRKNNLYCFTSNTTTPLVLAKNRNCMSVLRILTSNLFEERCICGQEFTAEKTNEYELWMILKCPNAWQVKDRRMGGNGSSPNCIIHGERPRYIL